MKFSVSKMEGIRMINLHTLAAIKDLLVILSSLWPMLRGFTLYLTAAAVGLFAWYLISVLELTGVMQGVITHPFHSQLLSVVIDLIAIFYGVSAIMDPRPKNKWFRAFCMLTVMIQVYVLYRDLTFNFDMELSAWQQTFSFISSIQMMSMICINELYKFKFKRKYR